MIVIEVQPFSNAVGDVKQKTRLTLTYRTSAVTLKNKLADRGLSCDIYDTDRIKRGKAETERATVMWALLR